MKKKILICIFSAITIFLGGCDFGGGKFFLDDEFYGTGNFIELTAEEFAEIDNQNYVLFTFNNFCALKIPCDEIFAQFMEENEVSFLSMKYDEFKKTSLHETVKFAPSVIIVKKGKIIAYLDSEKDEDLPRYQDVSEFAKWINKYVGFKIE